MKIQSILTSAAMAALVCACSSDSVNSSGKRSNSSSEMTLVPSEREAPVSTLEEANVNANKEITAANADAELQALENEIDGGN